MYTVKPTVKRYGEMRMKMPKRNVLSGSKLLVIAAVLVAHVGVCATPRFSVAKPVWLEGREKEWNCQVGFTAEFEGKDALVASNAVLRFTGATMCRVFLNGEFLGYGPARAAHGFVRVEELPLAGKVKPGRNVVAIEVAGYNCDSFYTVRQSSFLQAEIVAGGKVIAATDAKGGAFKAGVLEERVRKVQRFSFQRTFSEAYKVWPYCNEWRMGAKPPFVKPCTLAEQPQLPLLPRIVPIPDYAILPAKTLVATGTVKYDEALPVKTPRSMTCTEGKNWRRDGWKVSELEWIPYYDMQRTVTTSRKDAMKRQECRFPEDATGRVPPELEIPGNGFALVDFGFLAAGFPRMTIECDGPGTLYFCFDEVLENGDFNMKRFGSCDNIVAWRLMEAGVYNLEAFEPYAFRYGKLVFFGGKCKVSGLSIREYVNPEAGKAKFESSDPDINRIFEAARRTFAENAVDGFMDCPSRERAGWNCDAFFTGRVSIEFTGNAKEEEIFIQNFLLPKKFNDIPDGMLPQCYPADFPDHSMIPNWAMWFVLELDEYYARTGDRAMVDAFRPRILKLMDFFWKCRNEDGLLEKLPPSVFVEWSRSNALVRDVNYPTNMTWARVLEVVARLYGISNYAEEAERVRETVRRQSWNGTFFVDRALRQKDGTLKPDTEATETCQYYAFFFDTATPASHPELWKRLVEDFGPNRKKNNKWPDVAFSNAFIGNYLRFECLSKAGLSAQILDEAKGYFSFMAERTGTLWEHDAPTASCSHGFASHIAHVLYRDVLGVRNIDRVKKTIELRFPDVPLEHCSGEIPLEDGVLKVSWKKDGGKLSYHHEAPEGYIVTGVSPVAEGIAENRLHRITPSSQKDASYGRLLRTACADPWLFRHEGKFYLTQTGSSKVLVEEAKTLSGLSSPKCTKHLAYDAKVDPMLATLGYTGANGVWSPEIHHFSDDDFPGHAGWYMFTALRDSAPGDSRHVKSVVLKSLSGKPEGPYGNPVTGEKYASHLVLDKDGAPYPGWLVGQTVLRIREGEWKGVYSLFVSETGRGTADFHQEIRIARLKTPWQMASDTGIVTVPTQPWESIGSGPITDPVKRLKTPYYPRVVEGATAVYGDRGEVYLIYSGSGFWTNYGLGQLTWTGGDPLRTSSWVKYAGNPVFGVADGKGRHLRGVDKQGAGHASFFVDEAGKRHMVYHAYPYNTFGSEKKVDGITLAPRQKAKFRNAYVAPYIIDYTKSNGVSTGVFRVP